MDDSAHTRMLRLFRDIPDHRMQGKVFHKLHDILVIAVCAILAGLEQYTQMEDYAKANFDWFNSFLDLDNGIPSHDTFGNVFASLSPDAFEKPFKSGSMPCAVQPLRANMWPLMVKHCAEALTKRPKNRRCIWSMPMSMKTIPFLLNSK